MRIIDVDGDETIVVIQQRFAAIFGEFSSPSQHILVIVTPNFTDQFLVKKRVEKIAAGPEVAKKARDKIRMIET